jgi:hypothetical protein
VLNRQSTVSNSCMRFFVVLATLVMFLAGESFPRVAPTTLRELTGSAKLIVIGKVTSVTDVKGLKVAEVHITKTLKGAPQEVVYYLAQPTWTCDITAATVGEETLFFFEKYRFDPHPASMAYVRSAGAAGSYTVEAGATPVGAFKEPVGFRETITAIVGSSPFWQVSWSGRGQMPLRNVRNAKYVTLWIGDVQLPAEMSTISGPQREYSSFIRSVPLSQMLDFIQQVSGNLRKSRAQHNRP